MGAFKVHINSFLVVALWKPSSIQELPLVYLNGAHHGLCGLKEKIWVVVVGSSNRIWFTCVI